MHAMLFIFKKEAFQDYLKKISRFGEKMKALNEYFQFSTLNFNLIQFSNFNKILF